MTATPWDRLGLSISKVIPLSRNGAAGAFRLELSDGATLKARVFPTSHWASRVQRLLLASRTTILPRLLRREGHVLLSEFVDGTPLDEWLRLATRADHERLARDAGRLMARLHSRPCPPAHPPAPERYREHLVRVVNQLGRTALLSATEVRQLSRLKAPPQARTGLTHGDVCPENLILTPDGVIRAIDEERLAVRPLAYDLARSANRWPLDPRLDHAFLAGYAEGGGHARGFLRWRTFWIAAALASRAGYRLARAPESLGPTLSAMQRIASATPGN
jgi:aminoglycoside phosphotransferase (APT) family kinase protein